MPNIPTLSAALELLADPADVVDAEGRFLYVNPAFERLLGWTREEVLGKTADVLSAPTAASEVDGVMDRQLREGIPWRGVSASRRRSGEVLMLEVSATPIRSVEEGRIVGVLAIRRDVTARVRAEEDLRQSEALYRQIFHSSQAIKLLINPQTGEIVDANAAACTFYGHPRDVLCGMRIQQINTAPRDEVAAEMARALAERRTYFRFEHRVASGELRRVEVFTGPVEVHGVRLLLSIIHDVTDRERAEAELVRSEARFRALLQNLPVGVAVHREGRLLYANQSFAALLDSTPERIVGQALEGVIPLAAVPAAEREAVTARVRSALVRSIEEPLLRQRVIHDDGKTVFVDVLGIPMAFDGAPAVVTVLLDVTARTELEEQLQNAQRMESLGRLAGGVAHDFNNLLFVILNSARFLSRNLPSSDPRTADVERIESAARRASDLTRQLLLFSRGAESRAETTDASEVACEIARLLRGTLGEGVELVTMLQPGKLPVRIARSLLEQILVNLAVNARDAMPDGGQLRISTGAASMKGGAPVPAGRYVTLTVSDTGCGMEPEVAAHAFEPFYTTKDPGRGTGLGLSITYGIVQRAGGHIALDTAPGRGTTFRILLPAADEEPPQVSAPEPSLQTGRGEVVLLVEDDAGVRTLVDRVLAGAGYRVVSSAGPGEALLVAEQQGTIDLVLTDVMMPRMSGPELVQRLSRVRPGLPVLFMTGFPGDALAGPEGARAEVLAKPFTDVELLARVREVLASAGRR